MTRRSTAPAPGQLRLPPRDCVSCGGQWVPVELDGEIISLQCSECGTELTLGNPIPVETWRWQQAQPYVPTTAEVLEVMREEAKRGARGRGSRTSGRRRKKKPVRRRVVPLDADTT